VERAQRFARAPDPGFSKRSLGFQNKAGCGPPF
jgi:hypothetical protein